jgi:transposase InsO family protein
VPTPAEEQVQALQAQLIAQDVELRAARAREEIALTLPRVRHTPAAPEKKNAPPVVEPAAPAAWEEPAHMSRVSEVYAPPPPVASPRRGYAAQRCQRQREQQLRSHLVDLSRWTTLLGWTIAQTAALLGLLPRTLRHWQHDRRTGRWWPTALGRPVLRAPRADRQEVLELLDELGPATGLPTLQHCFPQLARAELEDLLRRYRRVWQLRHTHAPHVLRWLVPGAVWAMDLAEPPQPIDGLYPYLLAVRDLASGQTLSWLPLADATATAVIAALEPLFVTHGAPLVLKTDNGSAFVAEATADFFQSWEVLPLFSPPRTPQYNGAIEAGIGSLKTRSERQATMQGRPARWTSDDVAAAQAEANATARPHGPTGPTPDEHWQTRRPLSREARRRFAAAVAQQRMEVRAKDGWPTDGPLPARAARAVDRQAIRRALVEHGYLLFRRRRIPLPFTKKKVAGIT